jgi:hypothetical protein
MMTENCGEKVFWPSHKHIDVYTRDLARQLRDNNINIRKVYNIIAASLKTRGMCHSQKDHFVTSVGK